MQSSPKFEYPPEYKENKDKLADRFLNAISAVEDVQSQRSDRWRQNRAFYLNENAGSIEAPYPGAPTGHYNLFQSKCDSATGYILNTTTAETPYCEAKVFGDEDAADDIEEVCQLFCDLYDFETAYHQALTNAFLFNLGAMWVTSVPAEVQVVENGVEILDNYRVEFKVIEPEDFICYPTTVTKPDQASVLGHRFTRTLGEVKAFQESGKYEKVDVISESGTNNNQGWEDIPYYGAPPIERAAETRDEIVTLYYIVFRALNEKKKNARYVAVYCKSTNKVLSCYRYEMQTSCYQVYRMKRTSAKEGMYPGASKAQDLKQDQLDINKLKNQYLAAIDWTSGGSLFTDGYLGPNQSAKFGPMEIVTIPTAQNLVPFAPKADLNAIIAGIQMTDNHADVVTSISQTLQGAADPDADTAAENMLIAQGAKSGVDTLIGIATDALGKTWEHLRELLGMEVGDWYPYIGEPLGIERDKAAMMGTTCMFRPRVRTSSGTPQIKLVALQKAIELLAIPGNNINATELVKRQLKALEKVGGTSLEDLQFDPASMLPPGMGQMAGLQGDPGMGMPANPAAGGFAPGLGALSS